MLMMDNFSRFTSLESALRLYVPAADSFRLLISYFPCHCLWCRVGGDTYILVWLVIMIPRIDPMKSSLE